MRQKVGQTFAGYANLPTHKLGRLGSGGPLGSWWAKLNWLWPIELVGGKDARD